MDILTIAIVVFLLLLAFVVYKFVMKTTKLVMKVVVFGAIMLVLYAVLVSREIIPSLI